MSSFLFSNQNIAIIVSVTVFVLEIYRLTTCDILLKAKGGATSWAPWSFAPSFPWIRPPAAAHTYLDFPHQINCCSQENNTPTGLKKQGTFPVNQQEM